MKISIPEPVAAGALEALRESKHPDVRHLVRQLDVEVTKRESHSVLSVDELEGVLAAMDAVLVLLRGVDGPGIRSMSLELTIKTDEQLEQAQSRLRTARPKIQKLLDRQKLREGVRK